MPYTTAFGLATLTFRRGDSERLHVITQKIQNPIEKGILKIDMNQRPLVGIAVIVIKEDRVLLGKRKNSHGSGTWAFPGGHLEFNESIEDCTRREVFEETGIQIKNLRYGPYTNDIFADEGKHYVTLFVTAEYDSGTPVVKEPRKCEKWAWFQWPPDVHPCFLPITNLLKLNFKLPH